MHSNGSGNPPTKKAPRNRPMAGLTDTDVFVDVGRDGSRLLGNFLHTLLLQDLPLDTQRIEARLAAPDALQLDNTAWAVRSQATQSQVLIATEGNLFLERAMGLIPPTDVPPMFLITDHGSSISSGQAPTLDVDLTGLDVGTHVLDEGPHPRCDVGVDAG